MSTGDNGNIKHLAQPLSGQRITIQGNPFYKCGKFSRIQGDGKGKLDAKKPFMDRICK